MAKKKNTSPNKKTTKRNNPPENEPVDREAEPQDGPREREREFLEERLAPLAPKGAARPPAPAPPEDAAQPLSEQPPIPAGYRRQLVQEYRQRQQTQQQLPAPPEIEGAPPPPEPPQPPPANNWIPIGPSVLRQGQGGVKPSTSGRTPAIAVAPGGARIYIGAANGGVWRSDDTGQTWRSLMEAFDLNPTTPASDSLAVGAVAIDNANPDRVYVGSGEGAGGAYFGVGPIVTDNGTANPPAWNTESAAPASPTLAGTAFYALAVDPADPDRVVAASRQGVYRREPNGAGGFHWARKVMGVNTWVTSVVVASSAGVTTFYGARWDGPVYSSTDGNNWNIVGAGFPAAVGRISLAVQRDNPNILYALVQSGSVHRLDITDGTWRQITGLPAGFTTQGSYDLAIAVAPDNANRIYIGGSTVLSTGDWSGSLYRCELTVSGASVSMVPTYIGGSIHADVHTLVFAPGDASKLWIGCDGGVFYSTNPTGSGDIFVARNTGLQTLTMEYLAQHPAEDAVLFAGTQDNGGERFTGEEAWLYSSGGDAGFGIVNWNDPYKVLMTYVRGGVQRSTTGGTRYSYTSSNIAIAGSISVPLAAGEQVLFYAPIAGTPPNPGSPTAAADADLVAFGSIRPWISTTFGGGWQSIPNNTLAGDSLDERIKSLVFASPVRLYAGTMSGGVYRFDRAGAAWTRTQIDTLGGANQLPLAGPVTDIAVDPANDSRVYITFGGTGDYRHVWFFDGAQWAQRSGPAAGNINSLLDIQTTAIVVDPANPAHLYVGADLGVWRSTDSGNNWVLYSEGLPDAGVTDLLLHNPRRILRAATHGRGVYERTLPDAPKQGVELYVRSTQLDQGRFPAVNNLPDPTAQGQVVKFWRGPDIKLDTPDTTGQYQFPLTGSIDFLQFVDTLTDDFQNVATHATAAIVTRVYVQVHNRGVLPAGNVRVMLLLANASVALPALPAGYDVNVRNGLPINTGGWQTVGIETLNDVRVGFPKIAAFSLSSSMLPPPANLAGNQHHCVLAMIHHADDQFTNTETNTDLMSSSDRKAAHKNLTVVQFTGTLPPEMPVVMPFCINNPLLDEALLTDLVISLNGYPGRVRLLIPPIKTDGDLLRVVEGLAASRKTRDISLWAERHLKMIKGNLRSKHRYHRFWARQRIADVKLALEKKIVLEANSKKRISIKQVVMEPNSYHTIFLILDRPPDGRIGQAYDIEFNQIDVRREKVIGGLSLRVELVPEPGR